MGEPKITSNLKFYLKSRLLSINTLVKCSFPNHSRAMKIYLVVQILLLHVVFLIALHVWPHYFPRGCAQSVSFLVILTLVPLNTTHTLIGRKVTMFRWMWRLIITVTGKKKPEPLRSDFHDTDAMLYQLSEVNNWVYIFPWGVKWCEIYTCVK